MDVRTDSIAVNNNNNSSSSSSSNNNNNNNNNNVIKKEAEKILKYKDLTIEIQRMWKGDTSNNWSDWNHF